MLILEKNNHSRFICFLLLMSLAVGAIQSIRWIYPLVLDKRTQSKPSYMPIKNTWGGGTGWIDDYYYYSYVRDILSGNLFTHDPVTVEGKAGSRISPHYTYSLSLAMGAIGGLLTNNVEHAYFFNLFFYPLLYSVLLGWFLFRLTSSPAFSLSGSAFILHFTPNIHRMPHPMITYAPILLIGICLYELFSNTRNRYKTGFVLAAITGLSPMISVADFFICYSLFGIFSIYFLFRNRKEWRFVTLLNCIALSLSAPTLILLIKNRPVFNEILSFTMGMPKPYTAKDLEATLGYAKFILIPLALLLIRPFPKRRFFLLSLFGIFSALCLLSLLQGSFAGTYVVLEGRPLIFGLAIAGLYIMITTGTVLKVSWPAKFTLVGTTALVVWSLVSSSLSVLSEAKARSPFLFNSDQRELLTWAMKNTKSTDVGVSLDLEALIHLIDYAPMRSYVPQAILSPIGERERFERYFQTLAFFGVSAGNFKQWISKAEFKQIANEILTLYYGKYYGDKIPAEVADALEVEYRKIIERKNGLTYRHSHLVLSKRAPFEPSRDSAAFNLMSTEKPVFENDAYRVYLTRKDS